MELGAVGGVISRQEAADATSHEPGRELGVVVDAVATNGELRPERDGATLEVRWFTPTELAHARRVPWIDAALTLPA